MANKGKKQVPYCVAIVIAGLGGILFISCYLMSNFQPVSQMPYCVAIVVTGLGGIVVLWFLGLLNKFSQFFPCYLKSKFHPVSKENQNHSSSGAEIKKTALTASRHRPTISNMVPYYSMDKVDLTEIAALGRPFQLGMLYDIRKDTVVPDVPLLDWDLEPHKCVSACKQSTFCVITSDTINAKASALQVDGSLKLSFLTGLVNVSGAAKYFSDIKKSPNQRRLALKCRTTTKQEQLAINAQFLAEQTVSHPEMLKDVTATHVVSGVLYGADALFVFDREVSPRENKEDVDKEVKIAEQILETVNGVDSDAELNMAKDQTEAVMKFRCTYYGDLKLSTNPSTFKDALDVCTNVPKILASSDEDNIPLRVWLYPLDKIDARFAKPYRELSLGLTSAITDVIESLNMAGMTCNEFMDSEVSKTFPAVSKKFLKLKDCCQQYKECFLKELTSLLPLVRGGMKDHNDIDALLRRHDESPFSSHTHAEWISQKEKEFDVVKASLQQLAKNGVSVKNNLTELLMDSKIVVCFTFTSLEQPEPVLDQMLKYVNQTKSVSSCIGTSWLNTSTMEEINKNLELLNSMKDSLTNNAIKFIASSKYDKKHPGACIMVYESNECICFAPPSQKSVEVHFSSPSHDSVKVQCYPACVSTVERSITYRMQHEEEWKIHSVKLNDNCVTLNQLKPNAVYEAKCTAVGKLGFSVSSDITTFHTAVGPPTELSATEVKSSSVKVKWNCPEFQHASTVNGYIIEYKEENDHKWQKIKTEMSSFTLCELKERTTYSIRISTDCGVAGISKASKELLITTKKSLLADIRISHIHESKSEPALYNLNLVPESTDRLSKLTIGNVPSINQENKTIMLLGATGSGKTTLINGITNYILGVEWENTYRFKLINEVTNRSQAESQTSDVTAYKVYHMEGSKIPYSLTIIDTPGFGDTRGIKQDKAIIDKIRDFFSHPQGVLSIDAVCFVVQSALARLTHTQKYIFDSILSIFGKDIENNIVVLVTFADGKTPPVLEAIKIANMPCAKQADGSPLHFKFNNSALFAPNTKSDGFDQMFWNMGEVSMKLFFNHLDIMKTQSLQLTKEVLLERQHLEVNVQGLEPLIKVGLGKLEEINSTRRALEQHKDTEDANKDFEYELEVTTSVKVDITTGQFVTNCLNCNFTCHFPCFITNDSRKADCSAMDKMGKCENCPGQCLWDKHFNMPYLWDVQCIKEKRTYAELKKKYEEAVGQKMNVQKIGKHLVHEYQDVQKKVLEMIKRLTKCLKRLKKIALRPDPLATPDYIDMLIQAEVQEKSPGFLNRIDELNGIKEQAMILSKVAENVDLDEEERKIYTLWMNTKVKIKGVFCDMTSWFK